MKIAYIKLKKDTKSLHEAVKRFCLAGVAYENIIIGGDDYTEFLHVLKAGDELFIDTVADIATSMKEAFDFIDYIYSMGTKLIFLSDSYIIKMYNKEKKD